MTKQILLIEDDRRLARLAQLNLSAEGYQVAVYHEALGAMAYLEQGVPDLIILDLMLPTLTGWEFLDFLQQSSRLSGVPVLVVSALAHPDDERRARQRGAQEYLVKPFSIRKLLETVDRLLAISHEA